MNQQTQNGPNNQGQRAQQQNQQQNQRQAPQQSQASGPMLPALMPGQQGYVIPSAAQWGQLKQMGEEAFKSGLLPTGIKNPSAAAIVALKAYELGIPLMEGFAELFVIDGKVSISTVQMQKLVSRNMPELSWKIESTDKFARVTSVKLPRNKEHLSVSWTIEDARQAQLLAKDNWKKYPKAMLVNRALSAFFRLMAPEALCGCNYTPEELTNAPPGGEIPDGTIETTGRKIEDTPHSAPAERAAGAAEAQAHAPSTAEAASPQPPAAQLSPRQAALVEAGRERGWTGVECQAYMNAAFGSHSFQRYPEDQFARLLGVMRAMGFADAMNDLQLTRAAQAPPAKPEPEPEPEPKKQAAPWETDEGNSAIFDEIMNRHVRPSFPGAEPPAPSEQAPVEPGSEG